MRISDWSSDVCSSDLSRIDITVFRDTVEDQETLAQRLAPFSVACLMRERTPMSRALLERLPNLRHIVTSGMRNRSIDLAACRDLGIVVRSEEHTSELQSLMRISYAVFCLKTQIISIYNKSYM